MPGSGRGGKLRFGQRAMQMRSKINPESPQVANKSPTAADMVKLLGKPVAPKMATIRSNNGDPKKQTENKKEKEQNMSEETTTVVQQEPDEMDEVVGFFTKGARGLGNKVAAKMDAIGKQADEELVELRSKFNKLEVQAQGKMDSFDEVINERFKGQDEKIDAIRSELDTRITDQLNTTTTRIETIERELLIEEVCKLQDAQNQAEVNGIVNSTRLGTMQRDIAELKVSVQEIKQVMFGMANILGVMGKKKDPAPVELQSEEEEETSTE